MLLGVYYPGQAYPGRAPAYPAVVYTPTFRYRATVPYEARTVTVRREARTAIVPLERISARPRESRIAVVPRESRTASTEY
jgi:hypothetical protein